MISETDIIDQWTVVSDCITKPDESHQAVEILTTDMFTERDCRLLFEIFKALHADGLPTDINHVLERLETAGQVSRELGNKLHEAGCQARAPQPVAYYAGRVREHYRNRCGADILSSHHQKLMNGQSLDETISELQTDLMKLDVQGAVARVRRRMDLNSGYRPFPLHALPDAVSRFIEAASFSIGCDTSFVALPLLATAASAIGTSRRLMVKRGWYVPSILWAVVIGESGTQKSPPLRAVLKPVQARQHEQLARFAAEMMQFKTELQAYKRAIKKNVTYEGQAPEEPMHPACERCIVNDTTLEGLVPVLQQNARGVLLARDELVGWIGSFDKYSSKGNASADAAHWLSIYNGEPMIIDRKTGDKTTLFVPDASVSVCGGIQPGILNRVLSSEHRENGLAARLLLTYPPRQPKQWRDDEIPQAMENQWSDVVRELFAFQHDQDADGRSKPALIRLSDDARGLYRDYVNATGLEQAGLTGDLSAAWSKLEESAARLALVIHCIRQASGETVDPWLCDADSMRDGITLANWFKDETQRVYQLLTESQDSRYLRQVAEWIQQRGGTVRARDLVSGRRDIESTEQADELLQRLVENHFGSWRTVAPTERGGRPTRELMLFAGVEVA